MKTKQGFTLVEIMIVIAIIGLIASIALVNFIKARQDSQATMCSQFLERIDGAKAQAAFEHLLADAETPTDVMLFDFLNIKPGTQIDGSNSLCPGGGVYSVNSMDTPPSCSLAQAPGIHAID